MSVVLGSDILFDRELVRGRTVGIVCNPASVTTGYEHVVDRALAAGVTVGAIFGPQHGFRSDVQDNMIETPHVTDARRRVPVYSLYSETREPTAEMLAGLEALVIDLQDVGTRVYTYVYTMAHCMIAAKRASLPVIVCDRPNPIGGVAVEGPVLDPRCTSFVGEYEIPLRHGMTIGELARLFNDHFGIGCKLEIVQMQHWRRSLYHDDTGLPWVMPSPNIPTLDTASVYPGAVMFEGTNVSEGRGTTRPFELLGAPWVDPEPFAAALNAQRLPGVHFRPVIFEPTFHKHAKIACGGCQVHVTDRSAFLPVRSAIALIDAFHRADPRRFAWRDPPYEYERVKPPIDLLYGTPGLREALASGALPSDVADSWEPAIETFQTIRRRFLLYE
jgi:uncharacterized protein YbbC (DUF1343 family)